MVQPTCSHIKKINGHAPTAKTVNTKLEANRLADHFTTRADQTNLPKNTITALKEQLPLRQSKLAAAKQKRPDTHKQAVYLPRSFNNRILNLFNQS